MDLHPIVVHFPIALLTVYSLLELTSLKWNSEKWQFTREVLLYIGVLGAIAGYITGNLTGAADEIAQMHELFATVSIILYAIVGIGYLAARRRMQSLEFLMRTPVRVTIAILALIALSVTGALGGIMVHGPSDPFAELVYLVLFG